MNYYSHNIGDYAQATMHLSLVEDAIYSRLLRRYYAEEQPIKDDMQQVCRWVGARTEEERAAVPMVLQEFFELVDGAWRNKRADSEIAAYQQKARTNRDNGKAGGRPKKKPNETQPVSAGFPEETQPDATGNPAGGQEKPSRNPNQEPITNKYSVPNGTGGTPPEPPSAVDQIFALGLPVLIAAGQPEKQARSMLGMFRKSHSDEDIVRAIQQCVDDQAIEPVGYLQRVLRSGAARPARPASSAQRRASWNEELGAALAQGVPQTEIDMGVIDVTTH
ncbi:YdaU family protein [Achromobacter denitrificans]|uniref:YdaU family protein n=1 Tax=Achromobacter denitrificans TaxID=32002 RepID=UPI0023E7E869|nr:YdaU family protein [Achromobacter denitrificans]MDF3852326.1 YdaU family protein [Achromobacter denitrificans]